ncbi:MAG: hypothetical protein IJZ51_04040 [Ruminiclostridium sp.]|nr:hypothetical protein [Ruminiclostridium sp.]
MKKLNIYRKIAVILAFSVFTSVISGCAEVKEDLPKASDVYTELKCDSEISYNSQGKFTVNFSGTAELSDNINADDIKICYVTADADKLPQIDSEKGIQLREDEYSVTDITPTEVLNSGNSVSVSFTDNDFAENRPCGYIFIIDKDSNKDDKLLYSYALVKYSRYSMVSDTAHVIRSHERISVKLTLDKTSFSDKITEKDVTLSAGFSSCDVEKVERTGENTLTVDILCSYNDNSQTGYITVDKNVITDSSEDVTAEIRITSPLVITDMDGFEATFNYSCIPVSLRDATFTDSVSAEMLSCDNPAITINRVNRVSPDEALVYLSFDFESVEDAITEISSSTFTINETALNINEKLDFSIKPSKPDVYAQILSVTENGSDFRVKARFSVINGSFNVVSKTSFVFGGDYSRAVVETIQLQDDNAEIEFTIPKTSTADTAELYGTVALKASSLFNRWGENESIPAFPLRYSAKERASAPDSDKFSQSEMEHLTALMAKAWANAFSDDMSKLSNIGKVSYQDKKMLSSYLGMLDEKTIYFDNLHTKIYNCVHINTVTEKKHSITDATNKLDVFLSDVDMLKAVIMSAQPHLDAIMRYESADVENMTPEEVDKLYDEYKSSLAAIRTLFDSKIKGMSFAELMLRVADSYMAENGALYNYDYLMDCTFNWQPQTITPKTEFRYYVNGVLVKGYLLSLLSLAVDSELTSENELYIAFNKSAGGIAEFYAANKTAVSGGDRVFCNTLGRSFSLDIYSQHSVLDGVTSAQITQLVNMLPEGVTLKEELSSVGFDVSGVRYLICAGVDAGSSHSSSSKNDGEGAKKLYTHTSRAMVYDLTASALIEDFVYESYSTVLLSKAGELPQVSMLALKNTELYSLR